jgi:hypothetical protein
MNDARLSLAVPGLFLEALLLSRNHAAGGVGAAVALALWIRFGICPMLGLIPGILN